MNYESLKARHRAEREGHHPNLALRVHRALSWLNRAEQAEGDPDGRFIFLWIAFNAAYATEIDERYRLSEQKTFQAFLQKLVDLDRQGRIDELMWKEFPGSIRVLLDNQYVFQDFWSFHNGAISEAEWKRRFAGAKAAAHKALGARDTVTVLGIALSRIYTLRNQLMDGGATWGSSVNRDQRVPLVIGTLLDHPDTLWRDACCPVAQQGQLTIRGRCLPGPVRLGPSYPSYAGTQIEESGERWFCSERQAADEPYACLRAMLAGLLRRTPDSIFEAREMSASLACEQSGDKP